MSVARFAPKSFSVDTTDAIKEYFENGGAITVCKKGGRNRSNTSFHSNRGSIAYRGAGVESRRNKLGLSKSNG